MADEHTFRSVVQQNAIDGIHHLEGTCHPEQQHINSASTDHLLASRNKTNKITKSFLSSDFQGPHRRSSTSRSMMSLMFSVHRGTQGTDLPNMCYSFFNILIDSDQNGSAAHQKRLSTVVASVLSPCGSESDSGLISLRRNLSLNSHIRIHATFTSLTRLN